MIGTVWHVFDITEEGIKPVNEFYNATIEFRINVIRSNAIVLGFHLSNALKYELK